MGLVAPRHVGSPQTRARTHGPCIDRRILNHCASREALISIILIVLSTVDLQFQGWFVPISLRPILGIVPWLVSGHHVANVSYLVGVSVPVGQLRDFPGGTVVKNPPANAGDTGSSPGPGRSHVPRSN